MESSWITPTGVLHVYYLATIELSARLPIETQPGRTVTRCVPVCEHAYGRGPFLYNRKRSTFILMHLNTSGQIWTRTTNSDI